MDIDCFVVTVGQGDSIFAARDKTVKELRTQGFVVEYSKRFTKLLPQLDECDSLIVRVIVFVGENTVNHGEVIVRVTSNSHDKGTAIKWDVVPAYIRNLPS